MREYKLAKSYHPCCSRFTRFFIGSALDNPTATSLAHPTILFLFPEAHNNDPRLRFFFFLSLILSFFLGRRSDKRFNAWRPYASVSPSARKPPASFPQTTILVDPEIPLGHTIVTVPKTVHYLERNGRKRERERSTGHFSSSSRSLDEDFFRASRRNSYVTLQDLPTISWPWPAGFTFTVFSTKTLARPRPGGGILFSGISSRFAPISLPSLFIEIRGRCLLDFRKNLFRVFLLSVSYFLVILLKTLRDQTFCLVPKSKSV